MLVLKVDKKSEVVRHGHIDYFQSESLAIWATMTKLVLS
jgi:hypothetical protein